MVEDLTEARSLIRHGWEQVATDYAQDRAGIFDQSAKRLVELLHPSPGSRLLDIGTGSGVVARQAATWLGCKGKVVGCDFAATMVYLAAEQEAPAVTYCQMDAEYLGFPSASFDSVACAFSLFQFPDMDRALTEMWRVLEPGGRIGLSNWGPGYFSPVARLQRDLFRGFGLRALLTNPIAFKPDEVQSLLHRAAFTTVEVVEEAIDVWFEDPKEVWAFNLDMGPFPVMLERQLSATRRRELEQQYTAMLEPLKMEQGIGCKFHVLYALAKKGGAGCT
jgi:ubiquinone/menaquinone biosynthesis C-methylase UbiE